MKVAARDRVRSFWAPALIVYWAQRRTANPRLILVAGLIMHLAKGIVPATIKKLVRGVTKHRNSKVVGFDPGFSLPLDPTPAGRRRAGDSN
jgi:hypothetical protein